MLTQPLEEVPCDALHIERSVDALLRAALVRRVPGETTHHLGIVRGRPLDVDRQLADLDGPAAAFDQAGPDDEELSPFAPAIADAEQRQRAVVKLLDQPTPQSP